MEIAIIKNEKINYNTNPPFNPESNYPEYPFNEFDNDNSIYREVRNLFMKLGMDENNIGKKTWNPLRNIINPGDNVLIKPNFVVDHNNIPQYGTECLITNGSIIRAMLDFVFIALKGSGSITIGDAPIQRANFQKLIKSSGIIDIVKFYKEYTDFNIKISDFRLDRVHVDKIRGLVKEEVNGNSLGCIINLNEYSEFNTSKVNPERFRVTNYPKKDMNKYHNQKNHSYCISKNVLNADVIINLPKLKTHRLAGISVALKNIVGITASKRCLPHYISGSKEEDGDEYFKKSMRKYILSRLVEKKDISTTFLTYNIYLMLYYMINATKYLLPYNDPFLFGAWHGNNTISKTIYDLNKILLYADKNGNLKNKKQRKMFILVDGIIGGEEEGPLSPKPKKSSVLIAGFNNIAVDVVCSNIMGFDPMKIPTINNIIESENDKNFGKFSIDNINIKSDLCNNIEDVYRCYNSNFKPPNAWKGYLDR